MENSAIPNPNKNYSILQTLKFLPWISNYEYLKRMIHKDIENNFNETFKVKVICRKKKYYYFIKGSIILDIINKHNEEHKTNICVE
jgi:hypothetical protein